MFWPNIFGSFDAKSKPGGDNTSSHRQPLGGVSRPKEVAALIEEAASHPQQKRFGNSMRSDGSEKDCAVQGSRGLPASDGPRKENVCQRCGSLPALLAASAVRSQRRCLRQEIAWSRQPAIQSNLSSLRTGTPRKFVLSRWMLPMKCKPRRPSRRRLHPSETWTCS